MIYSTQEVADVLGLSKKTVLVRAKKEHWQYMKQGNSQLWIRESLPEDVQIALISRKKIENEKPEADALFTATEAERQSAKLRASIINSYKTSGLKPDDFCIAFNIGEVSQSLLDAYGKELTRSTLYRWLKDFKEKGISGLVPLYSQACCYKGILTDTERQLLEHFYLHFNRRTMRHCYLSMKANVPESTVSYATCARYLRSLPPATVSFYRDSQEKFEANFFPYISSKIELYSSMEVVQGDHHILDRLVLYKGQYVRPWLTSFADKRSGVILGWCLSTNPNAQTIMAAFTMMAVNFGLPHKVIVDNGKDYKGKQIKGKETKITVIDDDGIEREEEIIITGAIVTCGCELHYTRPYHGQSKAVQERFYGILEEYYSKNTNNYLGSNTANRVDEQKLYFKSMKGLKKRNDVDDWGMLVDEVAHWIHWYNNEWVSESKNRKNLTPMQAFNKFKTFEAEIPNMETLQLALTHGEVRTVTRNGVNVGGATYWSEELMILVKQQVVARVSLIDRNECLICNAKGQVICKAFADAFMETGNMEQDNEFVNRARRNLRKEIQSGVLNQGLGFKPKTLLDVAMESTGVELPKIEDFVLDVEKDVVGIDNTNLTESRKYSKKSYFDLEDREVI